MAATDLSAGQAALIAQITDLMPQAEADLAALVRIPSINFPDFDPKPVHECATAVADLFEAAGASRVSLVPGSSGVPTVMAELDATPDAPTVMLYSHYDVQPAGDSTIWESAAFEPIVRDGRMYGRGAADDKSGVVTHLTCVRALAANPPVNLRIMIEGEEEHGGDFEEWPATNPAAFAGLDAAVINDMGGVELGVPTFTTELRGVAQVKVSLRTLTGTLHSGLYGGPAPNALLALIRLLDSLTDENGDCAIAGIPSGQWHGADIPEARFREQAGVLPDVSLVGTGTIADRLISKPAVSVTGLDAPAVEGAATAIIPEARAMISVRIPASADWHEAIAAIEAHVKQHTPWGVTAEITPDFGAAGTQIATGNAVYRAYAEAMLTAFGREPVEQGAGGSIPFLANLVTAFPDLPVVATGAQDPGALIHAPNESIDLAELHRSITAAALFLQRMGQSRPS